MGRDERAVSPVVGMILVLAISVVGIAAILYWGLPAIDEMKANVEYRSVSTQFTELQSTIQELVSGTTEKTAKRWEPSINRGEVSVHNRSEGWVFSTETYHATLHYNFSFSDLDDDDNSFTITQHGPDTLGDGARTWTVLGYIVTGSSSQTTLNVTDATTAQPAQMGSIDAPWMGTTKTFTVWQKDLCCAAPASSQPQQLLRDATFHFEIKEDGVVVADMWWVHTGHVEYTLHAGVGEKTVILNNGAVINGAAGEYAIVNTPPIPPDATSSGEPRFFARALSLDGDVSFAGDDHFSLLISLYSTATLASYDCTDTVDYSDCVQSSKIQVFGDYAPIWNEYLTNTNKGYTFVEEDVGGGEIQLQEFNNRMAYTLLGSTLRVTT